MESKALLYRSRNVTYRDGGGGHDGEKTDSKPEEDLILTITLSRLCYSLPQLFSPSLPNFPVSSMLSSEHWER